MSTMKKKKNASKFNSEIFSKKFKINVRFSNGQKTIERSGKIVKNSSEVTIEWFLVFSCQIV